jgi:nucleoside-diphosphate-sugar epimerase
MAHYLITGATGFLGRHVLTALQQAGAHQIHALVRDPNTWSAESWTASLDDVTCIQGGVTDMGWHDDPGVGQLDGIFHFAAVVRHSREKSAEVYETNIDGTLAMVRLAAARKCRMVFVSTSGTVGVFGKPHEWADEHAPYQEKRVQDWPYYDSKIRAEKKARALAEELGVELVIIRPPVLLGPGDHRFRSTGHVLRHMQQRLPFLIEGGIHFVDIRDASRAMIAAMQADAVRPVYHLSGTACSISAFFEMVESASGVKGPRLRLPHSLAMMVARSVKGIARRVPGVHESPLPDPVVFEMAGCYWDVRSRYAALELEFVNREAQETIDDTVAWIAQNHPDSPPAAVSLSA